MLFITRYSYAVFIYLSSLSIICYPAPLTNQSTFREWAIGPVYYSALVMAEALEIIQRHSSPQPSTQHQHLYTSICHLCRGWFSQSYVVQPCH